MKVSLTVASKDAFVKLVARLVGARMGMHVDQTWKQPSTVDDRVGIGDRLPGKAITINPQVDPHLLR